MDVYQIERYLFFFLHYVIFVYVNVYVNEKTMSLSKTGNQPIRKITKVGKHSYAITIPMDYIRELKWRERQKVTVTKRGKKLIIEDWEA